MLEVLFALQEHMKSRLDKSKIKDKKQFMLAKEKISWVSMCISHLSELYQQMDKKDERITNLECKYLLAYQENSDLKSKNTQLKKDIIQLKELFLDNQLEELENE